MGLPTGGPHTQKEVNPGEKTLFCCRKYVEDDKHHVKNVPDLLESRMKPTDPVKEELWRMLF